MKAQWHMLNQCMTLANSLRILLCPLLRSQPLIAVLLLFGHTVTMKVLKPPRRWQPSPLLLTSHHGNPGWSWSDSGQTIRKSISPFSEILRYYTKNRTRSGRHELLIWVPHLRVLLDEPGELIHNFMSQLFDSDKSDLEVRQSTWCVGLSHIYRLHSRLLLQLFSRQLLTFAQQWVHFSKQIV